MPTDLRPDRDDDVKPPRTLRPFTIMFFLADDMIEIREQYPLNCGRRAARENERSLCERELAADRDNFPIFFRKGKMPMGAYKVEGPQAQARKKNERPDGSGHAARGLLRKPENRRKLRNLRGMFTGTISEWA